MSILLLKTVRCFDYDTNTDFVKWNNEKTKSLLLSAKEPGRNIDHNNDPCFEKKKLNFGNWTETISILISYLERLDKLKASMDDENQRKDSEELAEKMKELQIEETQLKEKEEKLNKQVPTLW